MTKIRNWLGRMSITWRLLLAVMLSAGLIMGSLIWYSYLLARQIFEQEVLDAARDAAVAAAEKIDAMQNSVEWSVNGLLLSLNYFQPNADDPFSLLEKSIQKNPRLYGVTLAFNEQVSANGGEYQCAYVFRQGEELVKRELGNSGYYFQEKAWYRQPSQSGKPGWSEPYNDTGGGDIKMITYSAPFTGKAEGKQVNGVVAADLSLQGIADLLNTIPVGEDGYAFLVSPQGQYVAQTVPNQLYQDAISRHLESAEVFHGVYVAPHENSSYNGKSGWLMTVPVASSGWWLGMFFARDNLLIRIFAFSRVQVGLGIIGFWLLLTVVTIIAHSITRPLCALEKATRCLAAGNLQTVIPVAQGDDEVARLNKAFRQMQQDLLAYIERLRETLQVQERIESDLRVAHDIQMSMVPKVFPPFPQLPEIDLYALLDPAKEVGGDFYDFCLLSEKRLCLIIGDVSGKGVPAALFMAATRTLFKAIAPTAECPAQILWHLNQEMTQDNDVNMFVTLFCLFIDVETGKCVYANAGHNPPLVHRKNGEVTPLPPLAGMAIGVFPDIVYGEGTMFLEENETLLLYTDGVTEAENNIYELYGLQQTATVLATLRGLKSQEQIIRLREDICRHAAGTAQSDDITMVVFQMCGLPAEKLISKN